MRLKVILLVLIGVCVVAAVYYVRERMEQYETIVWTGASKEALENPYLAAQKFLQAREVDVISSVDKLDFSLIDTSDIVFLSTVDSMLVSQGQIDDALDWVSRGGYLLVGVSDEIEGHASILSEFDITPKELEIDIESIFTDEDDEMTASERMREVNRKIDEQRKKALENQDSSGDGSKDDSNIAESQSKPEAVVEEKPKSLDEDDDFDQQLFDLLNVDYEHEYYRVTLEQSNQYAFLAVLDRITLEHDLFNSAGQDYDAIDDVYDEASDDQELESVDIRSSGDGRYTLNSWVSDENGSRLLQFEYGEGTFTAISSFEYWENDYIGLADHAYFLSYLVPDESSLHLFYNVTAPTLFELSKRYFFELLIASLVLLALWLWRHSLRVQALATVRSGQRRNFAEHLAASANFLVANSQYHVLIAPLKDDIESQLRPFYPEFSHLNESAQVAILAERTNISEQLLQQWLGYTKNVDSQEELISALKIGNVIRKKL